MQKYIEKMKAEAEELDGRILRAEKALKNPPFGSDTEGMNLLETQVGFMKQYSDVLHRRIEHEVKK